MSVELMAILWHSNDDGDVDFMIGPTLTNLMNGCAQRWPERLPRGFPDFFEEVREGRISLYEIKRKNLVLDMEDREP